MSEHTRKETAMAIYDEIGGEAAIDAALDKFFPKLLGDARLAPFYENVDMTRLRGHARAFLTLAFGGPNNYKGRDLRSAHHNARKHGLNEALFEVFMGHFRGTLEELSVPPAKIAEIVAIAEGGRNDVLGR
jgi:hemoglobin